MEARARRRANRGEKTVLFKIMEERGRTRLTSGVWARALDKGDPLARSLLDRAVRALGAGVASTQNVLDVEAIIIGGGLGLRLGEPYVERIREAMMPHLFADDRPPAVELAALGDLGGAIGASLLVTRASAPRVNRRHLVAGTDPFAHALLAAAVVAPLGRRPMLTAVVAGTLIDVDHAIAARSARPERDADAAHPPAQPRAAGDARRRRAGDGGGRADPRLGRVRRPHLAPAARRERRRGADAAAVALRAAAPDRPRARRRPGVAALALGSWAISRRAARGAGPSSAAAADGGGASAPPRTA